MNRRDFLHGTVVGVAVAAGTALVQLATPDEAKAVKQGDLATLIPPVTEDWDYALRSGTIAWIQDQSGAFVPIGYITEMTVSNEVGYSHTVDGYLREPMFGARTIDARVRGPVQWGVYTHGAGRSW